MVEFNDSRGSVGKDTVDLLERFFDGKFSPDYRYFLENQNGGRPYPSDFTLGKDEDSLVDGFYGITTKGKYDDIFEAYLTFKGRIPDNCISIGYDPFGNQICLAISGPEFGSIFFWDHEAESTSIKGMIKISSSFDEFLNLLCVLET